MLIKLLSKPVIALGCILFIINGASAQTQKAFEYEITVSEIQTAESAKEADDFLRPIFDVPAHFVVDGKKLIFQTNARLNEEQVIDKLLIKGLHVTGFTKNTIQ